jgi:ABC-type Fe3+/spermidine/putrescine transport system ATPase subunit
MVFQDYALFPHLSASDNIAFGLRLRRRPRAEINKRVSELLELVGLSHRSGNLPAQLSGGEQQRVAVARALAVDPEVVLLDEPLSNLDARLRVQMRRDLKRILSEAGVTVIFVTHDQAEAFAICDRVAVMRHGLIEDLGEPDRLYRRPATVDVARFVGEGNFFPADVVERQEGTLKIKVVVGTDSVTVGAEGDSEVGTKGQLLVRPESVHLAAAANSGLVGRVKRVEFQGAITQYEIDTGGIVVRVHALSAAGRYPEGHDVALSWNDADTVFFASKEV